MHRLSFKKAVYRFTELVTKDFHFIYMTKNDIDEILFRTRKIKQMQRLTSSASLEIQKLLDLLTMLSYRSR